MKETLEDHWLIFFNFSGYLAIYLVFIRISIPKENLNPPDIGQNNGNKRHRVFDHIIYIYIYINIYMCVYIMLVSRKADQLKVKQALFND